MCVGADDEPDDGPQHYILVLGFHQPHLIWILDAIGVHVANVIKVCSEEKVQTSEDNEESPSESPVLEAGKDLSVFVYLPLYPLFNEAS